MIKTYKDHVQVRAKGIKGIKGPSACEITAESYHVLSKNCWQRGNGSEFSRNPSVVHQFHIAQVLLPFVEKKKTPFVEDLAVDSVIQKGIHQL
jgi:hypothetical protein